MRVRTVPGRWACAVLAGVLVVLAGCGAPRAAKGAGATARRRTASVRSKAPPVRARHQVAPHAAAPPAARRQGGTPATARPKAAASTARPAPASATRHLHLKPSWGPAGYRNEVVVLMYHAFRTHPVPGDDITPADFSAQMALFHRDGYHIISLARLEAFVSGQATVPPNALVLTFDNGYVSMYRNAFPLLVRYHAPATIFPIARWLFDPAAAPPGLHPLTLAEARTMVASGLVSVGTQGWDLHRGIAVGPDSSEAADIGRAYDAATGRRASLAAYDQRVSADLAHAQRALTPLAGAPIRAFAYPFGDYRPRLIRLLHAAGFRYLFAAKLGWGNIQGQKPSVLYRINVGSYGETPTDALSAIRTVAYDTAQHPGWRPPAREIEVWHP